MVPEAINLLDALEKRGVTVKHIIKIKQTMESPDEYYSEEDGLP